jgi:RimJ/RimL family protein N-acetyltransferase
MIELTGKYIALRTLEREHCRQLWQEYEPEEPVPTEPLQPGYSIEGADKWFEEIQNVQGKTQVYLGIFSNQGDLIGDIQLTNIDWRNRSASIGMSITKREHRGRGYGTDAVLLLVKYAFEALDLFRLSARTLVHNAAARRVLENADFQLEGCEREAVTIAGRRWDRLTFGLLRSDQT